MLSCVFNLPKHNQKKPLSEKLHLYPGRLCHQTKEKYMNIYERKCIYKKIYMYVYLHPTRITLLASIQNYNNKKKHKTIRQMLMESPELLTKMYRV